MLPIPSRIWYMMPPPDAPEPALSFNSSAIMCYLSFVNCEEFFWFCFWTSLNLRTDNLLGTPIVGVAFISSKCNICQRIFFFCLCVYILTSNMKCHMLTTFYNDIIYLITRQKPATNRLPPACARALVQALLQVVVVGPQARCWPPDLKMDWVLESYTG